ncbi:MAG TPA: 30S ribosomal protein S4 [Planctomycetes bacterium]|nr:30S ribosomal protein S4 [Planctomycetota bacterium]
MARITGPKCRLCRREGMKLYLKGSRCHTVKCAVERRGTVPGVHTWSRRKVSTYGRQLREKQRLKRIYGVLERQFRIYFDHAVQRKGNTGDNLLLEVERRLDNVIRSAGFGLGPNSARQVVVHGHVMVNGRRCDRPSRQVKPGDVITITDNEKRRKHVLANVESGKAFLGETPAWLEVDRDKLTIKVVQMPDREQFPHSINDQLIVEGMSK